MAGIGFQLRKLSNRPSYSSQIAAYSMSAIISAGPWMISIMSLMFLTWLLHQIIPNANDIRLFTACVTHVYAFALIITGPLQLLLTRYVADQISTKHQERVFPSFRGGLLVTTILSAIAGGVFFLGYVPAPRWEFQVGAAVLLVYVSCIFIASVYLSALQEYGRIVQGFLIGYLSSVFFAWNFAQQHGITGAMFGLVLGHGLLFAILTLSVWREFGKGKGSSFTFVQTARKLPDLLLCGLFYNLGIWMDKFIFWWTSETRISVSGLLHAAPDYDLAIYLSLLSIVPGMAVFMLSIETSFAEAFETYFGHVNEGRSMKEILSAKERLVRSLQTGFRRLLLVQGLTTALLVSSPGYITQLFHVSFVQTGIFRITLFGTFLLVAYLAMQTVLFYFNDRKGALLGSIVFLIANTLLSVITVFLNEAWYGFGFVVAAGIALLITATRVNRRLQDLEYHTFNQQDA